MQFPKNLCDQLDSMVHKFWWNLQMGSNYFWTPIAWSTLCRSKNEGGKLARLIGIHDKLQFGEYLVFQKLQGVVDWFSFGKKDIELHVES